MLLTGSKRSEVHGGPFCEINNNGDYNLIRIEQKSTNPLIVMHLYIEVYHKKQCMNSPTFTL